MQQEIESLYKNLETKYQEFTDETSNLRQAYDQDLEEILNNDEYSQFLTNFNLVIRTLNNKLYKTLSQGDIDTQIENDGENKSLKLYKELIDDSAYNTIIENISDAINGINNCLDVITNYKNIALSEK